MAEWNYLSPEVRGGSREELPYVQSHRRRLRVPGCSSTGVAERSYPASEVRSSSREELPHIQGGVAVWAQEGQEELLHVQGQEGRL